MAEFQEGDQLDLFPDLPGPQAKREDTPPEPVRTVVCPKSFLRVRVEKLDVHLEERHEVSRTTRFVR